MLRALVKAEVRRPDDDDGGGADLRRVDGQPDRLGRRLRAALDGHAQAAVGGLEEEIGGKATLDLLEQDPLARGPEREDPVEPRVDEEVDERLERVRVELVPGIAQRRDRRRERATQRRHFLGLPARTSSTVEVTRRARVSGRFASSIHSTYSRRCVNDIFAKAAFASGSPASAFRRSVGTRTVRGAVSSAISTRTRSPASTPVAALTLRLTTTWPTPSYTPGVVRQV